MIDGTDAVMLSAETATGEHPIKAVEAMARVCEGAETPERSRRCPSTASSARSELVDEAIAMATMYTANHFDVKAIVASDRIRFDRALVVAHSVGSANLRVHPARSDAPTCDALSRRVPGGLRRQEGQREQPHAPHLPRMMVARGVVRRGERLIMTRGALSGVSGKTNTMKIIEA